MMKASNMRNPLLYVVVVVIGSVGCTCLSLLPYPPGEPICLEGPYSPPGATFHADDLVGVWKTTSGRTSVDTLTFREDGTFKQVYRDPAQRDYQYETPWNAWRLEWLPDEGVRVHLEGGRYYPDGIETAEREGLESYGEPDPPPMPFFDPIAEELVFMVGELVLHVRVDSSGELLLHHLWMHHDRGFLISGCHSEQFRRVETP